MKKFLFYFALMCVASMASGQQRIAVYAQRENTSGFDQGTKDFVVAEFVKALNGGQYTAVNRDGEFAEATSKELEYQQSGIVSDKQIARLGKQSGVTLVCVISFRKVLGEQNIEARIIDVETAEIVNLENRTVNQASVTTLKNDIVAIAKTLLGEKGIGRPTVSSNNEMLMFDKRYDSRIAGYNENNGDWTRVYEDDALSRMSQNPEAYQLYVSGMGMIHGWRSGEGVMGGAFICGGLLLAGLDYLNRSIEKEEKQPIQPMAWWVAWDGLWPD